MAYKHKPSYGCGTRRGYQKHIENRTIPCAPCIQANTEYVLEYRQKQPGYRTYRQAKHGTPSGARAHYRRGEQPCTKCRDANNRYRREQRAKRKASV